MMAPGGGRNRGAPRALLPTSGRGRPGQVQPGNHGLAAPAERAPHHSLLQEVTVKLCRQGRSNDVLLLKPHLDVRAPGAPGVPLLISFSLIRGCLSVDLLLDC